jgi:hypothetical protein
LRWIELLASMFDELEEESLVEDGQASKDG